MGCCCAKCYGDDDDSREHLIPSGAAGYQSLGKTSVDSKLELFDHSPVKVESVDNQFKQLTAEHNALISEWNKLEEARNNLTKGDREVEQNLDEIFHPWRDRKELPQVQIDHPNGNLTLINYSSDQITKEQQEMLDHFNKISRMADKLMKTCPKLIQDMDNVLQDKISFENKVSTEVSEEQQDTSLTKLKATFENLNIMRLNIEQVKAHTMMTCERLKNAASVLQKAEGKSREERDEHRDAAATVSDSDGESGIEMRSERSDAEGTKDAIPSPSAIPPSVEARKPDDDTPVGAPSPYSLNFDQQTSQEDQVDKGDAVDAVEQKPDDTGQDTSESDGEHGVTVIPHSPSSTTSESSTEKAGTSSSSHQSDSSSVRHYTSTEEESIKDETGSAGQSPQDQDVIPREDDQSHAVAFLDPTDEIKTDKPEAVKEGDQKDTKSDSVIGDETATSDGERAADIDTKDDASAKEPDHETSADETLPTDQSRSDDSILSADITDVTDTSQTLDVTTGDEKSDGVPDSSADAESAGVEQQSIDETDEGQKPPAD